MPRPILSGAKASGFTVRPLEQEMNPSWTLRERSAEKKVGLSGHILQMKEFFSHQKHKKDIN